MNRKEKARFIRKKIEHFFGKEWDAPTGVWYDKIIHIWQFRLRVMENESIIKS